jgi:hypothetical protein
MPDGSIRKQRRDRVAVGIPRETPSVFVDLFYLRELVRPGGPVILDDYSYPSVATAVRYFEANTGWQTEPMSAPTRLRAFRLPIERTEPSFESFKPFGLDPAP